ncbi:MAG: FAD-binding domain-containing protein [Pseudomonadota bacterium]
MQGSIRIVWFKRDLRVEDHAPLCAAAEAAGREGGRVLPLYIVEPEYWRLPDVSGRQWAPLAESVAALDGDLRALGGRLTIRVGEAAAVFATLAAEGRITAIHAHEETGNQWTYRRDRAVAAWAREAGIALQEAPTGGVQRRLRSRDGWAKEWERRAALPQLSAPEGVAWAEAATQALPRPEALGLDVPDGTQPGGRGAALSTLGSFLEARGARYHKTLSSPLTAYEGCSRLSLHLALGTLSTREVAQAARARLAELRGDPDPSARDWRKALGAFDARLHWRCHFMQKLESEPRFETENVHPAFDAVRPEGEGADRLAAWAEGRTGLPFVDACMRALNATGWINFRMRAMLQAVASYHLWLHWRGSGLHLARAFADYEPGIHWNQSQMQSGTTGINTVRLYNPVKQGKDHDPQAIFIRRWVPEVRDLTDALAHEPWRAEAPPKGYPPPMVDVVAAAKAAKDRIYAVRRGEGFREAANAIQAAHGSRKSGLKQVGAASQRAARRREAAAPDPRQWRLDL